MNKNTFYAKRLSLILDLYLIERGVNELIKSCKTLDPDLPSQKALQEYIYNSKLMRFKPYIDKMLTDIREIHEPLQFNPKNP